MTLGDLERQVYDLLGVTQPPWPLVVRTRRLLNQAYLRVAAEAKLNRDTWWVSATPNADVINKPDECLEIETVVGSGGRVLRMASLSEYHAARAAGWATDDPGRGPVMWVSMNPWSIMVWPPAGDPDGVEIFGTRVVTEMQDESYSPEVLPEPWHGLLAWMVVAQIGGAEDRALAQAMVADMRAGLFEHVADRGGDDTSRIKLRGYPGRQ